MSAKFNVRSVDLHTVLGHFPTFLIALSLFTPVFTNFYLGYSPNSNTRQLPANAQNRTGSMIHKFPSMAVIPTLLSWSFCPNQLCQSHSITHLPTHTHPFFLSSIYLHRHTHRLADSITSNHRIRQILLLEHRCPHPHRPRPPRPPQAPPTQTDGSPSSRPARTSPNPT